MFKKLRARIAFVVLLLLVNSNTFASFHLWRINEVYSNADRTVQFIEFASASNSQELVGGVSLTSSSGGITNSFTFPNDLPSGTLNKKFLVGTSGFAALGIVTPDFIVPNGFVFTSAVTINLVGAQFITFPSIPIDGTLSVDGSNATATNSPTNFAGTMGTVVISNPTSAPGAPTGVTATRSDAQATIFFSPPVSSGSSAIVGYDISCLGGFSTRSATGSASPITVTGLNNTFTYDCAVSATNATNTGPPASVKLTPFTVPGAPTINSILAGDSQASIDFSPPANNGGTTISSYTANCGGAPVSGGGSPITVGGLSNGTTYSCTVAATNNAGTGPPSSAMSVTPGTVAGAPTITSAVAGNTQATISFTPPASNGGSNITSYGVTCNPGSVAASGAGSPITVTGLTNATVYSCSVVAFNAFGPGAASAPVSVTPAGVPSAPVIGSATAGNTVASIAFSPPASNGGSAITGFTAICNPGNISAPGGASPISVTGLTNGTVYRCSVTASNAVGTGAASATVNVVPATVPGAPTINATIPGDGRGSVSFSAPASNGGAAIISFTATCGGISVTGSASPITVTALANNVSTPCNVIATNAIGSGSASLTLTVTPDASAQLTPLAVLARKTHGGAGTFDVPVDTAPGAVTAEPRIIGNGHTIVFQFNVPITATGTVSVTPVGTVTAVQSGFDVVVTLANVPDNQRATISLANVNGAGVNVAATFGFLVGDVNNSRSINASDISGAKARLGQTTSGQNFRFDINATGTISPQDVSAIKARSGLVLPP